MAHRFTLLFALGLALVLGIHSQPARAQGSPSVSFDLTSEAETYCLNTDTTVLTLIDASIVGTDSLNEVMAHEAVHHRQYEQAIKRLGHCPMDETPATELANEVEAYCVSDSFAIARGRTARDVSDETLSILLNEFGDVLPVPTILNAWSPVTCPAYALPTRFHWALEPGLFIAP